MEQQEYLSYEGLQHYHDKLLEQLSIPQIKYIFIEALPTKLSYNVGEPFDPSGIVVKAKYNDGLEQIITDYTVTPEIMAKGTTDVSICYGRYCVNVSVTVSDITIYGVEWDWDNGSSTKGVRTDGSSDFVDPSPAVNNGNGSSPFDDLYPWCEMVKENRVGGIEVKEPKYWYKWTKTGKKLKLQIADGPVEGFYVDPVNMDRGDGLGELDFSYIGRHHCASETYKSETSVYPQRNVTRSSSRASIHNIGSYFWNLDFAQMWYIGMLYLVEYADWNGRKTIGKGGSSSGSIEKNGSTDAMQYHTGTTALSRDSSGGTQYRNVEGWWDNVYDWIDGCYCNSNGLHIILNPNQFSDSENGVLIGQIPPTGFPDDMVIPTQTGFEWALFPLTVGGSDNTYISDSWTLKSNMPTLLHGGVYLQNLVRGPFFVGCGNISSADGYNGCRLQERPPKEDG